ncbi:MAG: hypoxanthine phosphoribosyltransferase, partial [Opitutae bacterium]|nr:hypoxanthine phosphoribosyltransferase [Opitutae bacterium]
MTNDIQEILLDEETISQRVRALGAEIDVHYEGEEILLITLLDGAIVFTADLIRNLRRPLRLDCIRVSSYGDSTSPESSPRILGNLRAEVEGRHVLLVDDILDTGNTLSRVQNEILSRNPASVHSCVLLDKPA